MSEKCVKWEESDGTVNSCLVAFELDSKGYFVTIKNPTGSTDLLEISNIRDVRIGEYAKQPKDKKVLDLSVALCDNIDDLSQKCLTICSGSDFVNLIWNNFIFKSEDFAKIVYDKLIEFIFDRKLRSPSYFCHLEKIWQKLANNITETLDSSGFTKIFTASKEDKERILEAMKLAKLGPKVKRADFTFDSFLIMFRYLFMQDLFLSIYKIVANEDAQSKQKLNSAQFCKFINQFQRDKRLNEILFPVLSESKAKDFIRKYETDSGLIDNGEISTIGLTNLIFSQENNIIDPKCYDLNQEMSEPLNHYFINSSHNSYLSGHQLTGKSSAEIYRQILVSGCRCIELDIWDGKGVDDEPIVTHGFTMCTAVPLRDVIDAIDESAFKASPYPVILSFENHCTPRQLPTLVSIVQEKLADKILKDPLPSHPLEPGVSLPSPEALKFKILIKNKKKATVKVEDNVDSGIVSNVEEEDEKATEVVVPEISTMVNYVEPSSFESFEKSRTKNVSYECNSFGETFAMQLLNEDPIEYVNFNKRQISRIYPKGTRVDSSNFLPQLFWNSGCQLVALNFQTLDLGMQHNLGFFEQQSRYGYLLKPIEMRAADKRFDPFLESGVDGVVAVSLKLRIISGQFIGSGSDKDQGTIIEVEMYGLPADTVRKTHRLKSTTKNCFNPQFPNTFVTFRKIIFPKLAIIRLIVTNESSKSIGQAWLPVEYIRPGYRFVTLRNESCQPQMTSSLLLYTEVDDYVPCEMEDLAFALSNPIAFLSEREKRAHQLEVLTEEFTDDKNEDEKPIKIENEVKERKTDTNIVKTSNTNLITAEAGTTDLATKKKQQTKKVKASFKKKSSIKRGKSMRGLQENEEISEYLKESILNSKNLIDLSLEKLKSYKRCLKIIEKRDKILDSLKKKYEKKVGVLTRVGSQDTQKSVSKLKMKSYSQDETSEDSENENEGEEPEPSDLNTELVSHVGDLDKDYKSQLDLINSKYLPMYYEELHNIMEGEINTTKKRIEKIYKKENDVLLSLQNLKLKYELKSLQKESTNKDEFTRLKREAHQKHIQQCVTECQKLTQMKDAKLKELEEKTKLITDEFNKDKEALSE